MSLGRKPTAFVSSTCYDLKQVRDDIRAFFQDQLGYDANRLIDVYSSIIDWSLDFSTIVTEDDFSGIVTSFSKMCEVTLCDIERFSEECCEKLLSIPDAISESSEPMSINLTLSLSSPDTDGFYRELNALLTKLGISLEDN